MSQEQLDGPVGYELCLVVDEVYTLELDKVVGHDSGDKALQLLHIEGTGDIWLVWTGDRSVTRTRDIWFIWTQQYLDTGGLFQSLNMEV